jgi:hypothetical protein
MPMPRLRPFYRLNALVAGVADALMDEQVRLRFGLTLAVIAVATIFYRVVEGWPWIDAAFFATVTISTVGYGDVTPATVAGKLFTMVYIVVGIGLFVAAGTALAEHLIRRARAAERSRRRHGASRGRPGEDRGAGG